MTLPTNSSASRCVIPEISVFPSRTDQKLPDCRVADLVSFMDESRVDLQSANSPRAYQNQGGEFFFCQTPGSSQQTRRLPGASSRLTRRPSAAAGRRWLLWGRSRPACCEEISVFPSRTDQKVPRVARVARESRNAVGIRATRATRATFQPLGRADVNISLANLRALRLGVPRRAFAEEIQSARPQSASSW